MDAPVPLKDEAGEHPVPVAWRPVIKRVVDCLVLGDFELETGLRDVEPVPVMTSTQIREAVRDYGASLIALDSRTWESSIACWNGESWDVLVDLWTAEEGRSDLVLHLTVWESESSYRFAVYLAYVP